MGPVVVLANSFASTVTIGYVASIDAAGAGHIYCSVFHIGRRGRHGDDVEEGILGEKGDELGHEIDTDSSVIYIRKLMVLTVGGPPTLIQLRLVVDTHWPCLHPLRFNKAEAQDYFLTSLHSLRFNK